MWLRFGCGLVWVWVCFGSKFGIKSGSEFGMVVGLA